MGCCQSFIEGVFFLAGWFDFCFSTFLDRKLDSFGYCYLLGPTTGWRREVAAQMPATSSEQEEGECGKTNGASCCWSLVSHYTPCLLLSILFVVAVVLLVLVLVVVVIPSFLAPPAVDQHSLNTTSTNTNTDTHENHRDIFCG
jgi:hypothetical protein